MSEVQRLAKWMREERTKRRVSTRELADMVNAYAERGGETSRVSQQTLSAFEQGQAKRIPHWFTYVRMLLEGGRPAEEEFDDEVVDVEELPTYAGAGGGGSGEGDRSVIKIARFIVERELNARGTDLLSVLIEGNSMSPDFESGDRLLVDRRKTTLAQPGAFCLWDGDGYVVKYLERVPGSEPAKVRVISRNAIFSTGERLAEEVQIMGRVVWFARKV